LKKYRCGVLFSPLIKWWNQGQFISYDAGALLHPNNMPTIQHIKARIQGEERHHAYQFQISN
jgi:hypothetical protein